MPITSNRATDQDDGGGCSACDFCKVHVDVPGKTALLVCPAYLRGPITELIADWAKGSKGGPQIKENLQSYVIMAHFPAGPHG